MHAIVNHRNVGVTCCISLVGRQRCAPPMMLGALVSDEKFVRRHLSARKTNNLATRKLLSLRPHDETTVDLVFDLFAYN